MRRSSDLGLVRVNSFLPNFSALAFHLLGGQAGLCASDPECGERLLRSFDRNTSYE